MKQEVHLAALLALAMFVQASTLLAQQPGQQPCRPADPAADRSFRGLFGGARPDHQGRQVLSLYLSTLGGYDDNVLAEPLY
jgi:hypothetical protein